MDESTLRLLSSQSLSQREIAEKLNLSQTTIKYWLNKLGILKIDKINKFCKRCNTTKPRTEFYDCARRKSSYCKPCSQKHICLNISSDGIGNKYDNRYIYVDKDQLIELINKKLSFQEIADILKVKASLISTRAQQWGLKSKHIRTMSPKERAVLSEKRKKYLLENPDKHPWKTSNRKKSVPCEKVKSFLIKNNIRFMEEFSPCEDYSYSIDIAFPDRMVAIEINGNQHYERDGRLKPYYQERHDRIESLGWKLYEIP